MHKAELNTWNKKGCMCSEDSSTNLDLSNYFKYTLTYFGTRFKALNRVTEFGESGEA